MCSPLPLRGLGWATSYLSQATLKCLAPNRQRRILFESAATSDVSILALLITSEMAHYLHNPLDNGCTSCWYRRREWPSRIEFVRLKPLLIYLSMHINAPRCNNLLHKAIAS